MTFSIGDRVTWTSQSASYRTTKRGAIVAIVPAFEDAHDYIPVEFRCNSSDGFGSRRKHASYLIRVDGKGRKLYWPRIIHLKKEA